MERALERTDCTAKFVIGNDESTDGEKNNSKVLVNDYVNLKVIHSQKKGNYGGTPFKAICANKGKYVVTLDSFLQLMLTGYQYMLA